MNNRELIKIAKKHDLKLLILFGSRARGDEKKGSDWDFAYYPPAVFSVDDDMALFEDLMSLLSDEKIDLLNLKKTKKLYVAHKVFQTGKVVYEKEKGFFSRKKWDAFFDWQDFKRYSDWQFELTKQNLKRMAQENG
jgi:uncharacterized protein